MSDVTVLLRTVAGNDRSVTTRSNQACLQLSSAGSIDRITCRYARGLMSASAVGFRLFKWKLRADLCPLRPR